MDEDDGDDRDDGGAVCAHAPACIRHAAASSGRQRSKNDNKFATGLSWNAIETMRRRQGRRDGRRQASVGHVDWVACGKTRGEGNAGSA